MANYRVAVIGAAGGQAGGWCNKIKKWNTILDQKLDLIAVCDINETALKQRAAKFNCASYTNYIEMYDKEKPDIVIIGTPHFLHAPMAIAAAERNINVLTEKPMCINLKQADAMANAVEKSKIKLAVGFQHRFNPIYIAMKRVIESGDLGDIFQMNMMFHWWRNEKYYLNSSPVPENKDEDWEGWRGHWKTEGAGALANQIVHFMDVFQWLSPSRPKSIMAASRVSKHTLVETDDNTNAIVEFENGSMGFIQAGVAYEFGREEEYRIYGTKGAIIRANNLKGPLGIPKFYEDLRPKAMKVKRSMLSLMPKSFDFSKQLFTNFLQAILKDDPKSISVDVHEGRKSIEIMRGIILSQKYEKKIAIPFDDTPTDFPKLLHTYVDPEFKDML